MLSTTMGWRRSDLGRTGSEEARPYVVMKPREGFLLEASVPMLVTAVSLSTRAVDAHLCSIDASHASQTTLSSRSSRLVNDSSSQ
jgi:hypothetical protein